MLNQSDSHQDFLQQLSEQLSSSDVKDRVLAMVELQKDSMSTQDAEPLIQRALQDTAVQVRGMAVFSLGIKPISDSLPRLVHILESDSDYNIRAMAAGALGYLGDQRALEALRHAFLEETSWLVQFSAAVSLGNLKHLEATSILLIALESHQPLLQEAAIMALGEIGAVEHIERLLAFAASADWMMRKRLAEALGNLPCSQSQAALQYLCDDPSQPVAEAAVLALKQLTELPELED